MLLLALLVMLLRCVVDAFDMVVAAVFDAAADDVDGYDVCCGCCVAIVMSDAVVVAVAVNGVIVDVVVDALGCCQCSC